MERRTRTQTIATYMTAMAAAMALAVTAASTTHAQPAASMSQKTTASVQVVSVDMATRHLVVKRDTGETFSLQVPPEVRNLDQVKPGDTLSATYVREVAYAVSPPGQPLPENTATIMAARAAKGEMPAAAVANHIMVTGAVLGIDLANSTVKVVNPKGGEVHEFDVVTPEGRQLLGKLKVGDMVTAYVTEALLVSVNRS
jgi:hypothetical protein